MDYNELKRLAISLAVGYSQGGERIVECRHCRAVKHADDCPIAALEAMPDETGPAVDVQSASRKEIDLSSKTSVAKLRHDVVAQAPEGATHYQIEQSGPQWKDLSLVVMSTVRYATFEEGTDWSSCRWHPLPVVR